MIQSAFFRRLHRENQIKQALFSLLLATCAAFTACTDETDEFRTGTRLQLNVATAKIESRALIESATLPDGHSIGLMLVDGGGTQYDGVTYRNIKATASTGKTPQSWALQNDILLSATQGTLYGYYPYNADVTDFTQVPVESASQTDYMYATPVTGVDNSNEQASVAMQHALAAVRLNIVRGTYTGTGAVTSVSVKGSNVATSGKLNAKTGALSSLSGTDTDITDSGTFTLTSGGQTKDIIFVPASTSGAPTFMVTIDDKVYTATGTEVAYQQGCIYKYTLTINNKDMSLSDVTVGDWGYSESGNPVINAGYKVTIAGNTEDIAFTNKVNGDGSVTITAVPVEGNEKMVNSVSLSSANADLTQAPNPVNGGLKVTLSNIKNDVTVNFDGISDYAWVKATYKVTDNSTATQIFTVDISDVAEMAVLEDDGSRAVAEPTKVTPAGSYQFSTTGTHTVYVKFADVTWIFAGAFAGCTELTGITVPNSVDLIGPNAFTDCTGLTGLTISNSVTAISIGAFANTGLTGSLTIPNSVELIDIGAFEGCTGLTSLVIPNSVTTIGASAFSYCTGLTSITIPNSVETIESSAFRGCPGLKVIDLGTGLRYIGYEAFEGCSGVTSITSISSTAPSISSTTFYGVKSGGTLYVPAGATGYDEWMRTEEGCLGYYNWTKEIIPVEGTIDLTTAPNGVYAVAKNGKGVAVGDADESCVAVALITDNQRILISKADATDGTNSTLYWGYNLNGKDVAGITKTTDQSVAKADFGGKDNTDAIIAAYTEHSVAMDNSDMCKVLSAYTEGGFTDWYTPAAGQLYEMYTKKSDINAALANIGGTTISNYYYWSSSGCSYETAWLVHFDYGNVGTGLKYGSYRVRLVRDIE